MPPARKHFCKARPASSVPIAPNISTCAPSAAKFAATFPAPPKHSLCETKSTTGTAASGESRVAVPHKYRSNIKSPSTPMRFPRNFGISFFNRGRYSAILVGIRSLFRLPYLITSLPFYFASSIFASSGSITGISSRTGYTLRQVSHLNPVLSAVNFTGVLQIGQAKISSNFFEISMQLSIPDFNPLTASERSLYQSGSNTSNPVGQAFSLSSATQQMQYLLFPPRESQSATKRPDQSGAYNADPHASNNTNTEKSRETPPRGRQGLPPSPPLRLRSSPPLRHLCDLWVSALSCSVAPTKSLHRTTRRPPSKN